MLLFPTTIKIFTNISTCLHEQLSRKESACNAGDLGLIPGLGRSTEDPRGNLPRYSCLENPKDRGAWQALAHRVAQN